MVLLSSMLRIHAGNVEYKVITYVMTWHSCPVPCTGMRQLEKLPIAGVSPSVSMIQSAPKR